MTSTPPARPLPAPCWCVWAAPPGRPVLCACLPGSASTLPEGTDTGVPQARPIRTCNTRVGGAGPRGGGGLPVGRDIGPSVCPPSASKFLAWRPEPVSLGSPGSTAMPRSATRSPRQPFSRHARLMTGGHLVHPRRPRKGRRSLPGGKARIVVRKSGHPTSPAKEGRPRTEGAHVPGPCRMEHVGPQKEPLKNDIRKVVLIF